MDNTSLSYRRVAKSDFKILNKMMRAGKGYWGYPEEGLDRFIETFGIKDESYLDNAMGFIAEENERIIGYYIFLTDKSPPMLDHFFLDIPQIGKGYGRILWDHCIAQVRIHGWSEFIFWSDPNSMPFYEHMGAVTFEYRPMVTMPGLMAPIMRYVLKA